MSKTSKFFALFLALIMAMTMTFSAVAETAEEPAAEATAEPRAAGTVVYGTSPFGQKFSPFFSTVVYDTEVVELVTLYTLAADRGGAVMNNGGNDEGQTVNYNGTDYTYRGASNLDVVMNDDGSVDYNLTMRDDIVFSDGEKATIDDVIFSMYVMSDPTYDGSSTLYALPIEGIKDYHNSLARRADLIRNAGKDGYVKNDQYTEEQYNAFWKYYEEDAVNTFVQEIVDYLVAHGYNTPEDSMAAMAANWGYSLEEGATAKDFFDAMIAAYDDPDEAEEKENAGSTRMETTLAALGEEYAMYIPTSEGVDNIPGIIRTGDYSMTVHMTEYDATAIYQMVLPIAPLHYYGDKAAYDYASNKFGFEKGDLSGIKAKNTQPLGAGPYTYEGYANGVVTLKANATYFKGEPEIKVLLMKEAGDSDYVPGTLTGSFDVSGPSINDTTVKAIKDANGNDSLTGDKLHTVLVDYRGYGYLGINADLVNMGDPASDESKALRKGFMTLFAIYRDTVINSYYGDRASVIQYPISNTSWAAPKPADEGYRNAYSVDVDGNPIYDASMSEEQRYEAAKQAAIGYFKKAGLPFDEATGKFTTDQTWEVMIPGQGQQDHPAYGIVVAASNVLDEIGIKLQVNDVGTAVWNNALESNTAMMWAAAWQASVDPDMTQVYSSANAHGNGTNSNHYAVDDAELDELIAKGRSSADTEERKSIYKAAMEIIMDWGCELPTYQRKECTVYSAERVDISTIPQDMTPYWNWYAEIETMAMK